MGICAGSPHMHIGSSNVERACCSKSRNKSESPNIPESCRLPSERIKIISLFFKNKLRNSLSFPHLFESVLDLAVY